MNNIVIENSKDGNPIPIINNISLHSKYAPYKEGEKISEIYLRSGNNKKDIIIFGLGFGYHIIPLLDIFKKIYVFEPLLEIVEKIKDYPQFSHLLDSITIITDINAIPKTENKDIFCLNSVKRFFPDYFEQLQHKIESFQLPKVKISPDEIRVLIDFPIYGGSLTTANYVKNAFTKLGYITEFVENDIANNLLQEILKIEDKNHSAIMSSKLTELMSDLFWYKFQVFQPHVCFFNAQSPMTPHLLRIIKEKTSAVSVFWFVEDYKRFNYWKNYSNEFDFFCCIQKGDFFEILRENKNKNFAYIPMAADESIHRKIYLNSSDREFYGSDISFMGAGYNNRHLLFSQLLDYDLKIWGTDWGHNPIFKDVLQKNGERISIEESVKIYNATKININLHSSIGDDYLEQNGDFINPRTFEIMACGGFQLIDKRSLISELFNENEEIVTFDSLQDLRDKIDFYLTNEDERKRIAKNGQRKVLNNHTYKHRISKIMKILQERIPQFSTNINNEKNELKQKLERINDPELFKFMESLSPEKRMSTEMIIGEVKKNQGKFKNYEVIILALETFLKNI